MLPGAEELRRAHEYRRKETFAEDGLADGVARQPGGRALFEVRCGEKDAERLAVQHWRGRLAPPHGAAVALIAGVLRGRQFAPKVQWS